MDRRSFLKSVGLAPVAAWIGIKAAPQIERTGVLDAPQPDYDLADVIYNISPTDTPFISKMLREDRADRYRWPSASDSRGHRSIGSIGCEGHGVGNA